MSQFQHLLPFFHFTINIVLNYETISVVCFSFTLHFIKPYLKNWVFTYPEKNFQVFNELIFFSFASHMTASLFIAVGYFFFCTKHCHWDREQNRRLSFLVLLTITSRIYLYSALFCSL